MSNNNDMKLIMEEWRRIISEAPPEIIGTGSDVDAAARQAVAVQKSDNVVKKVAKSYADSLSFREHMRVLEISAEIMYVVAQIIDPTGITGWSELKNAWKEYVQKFNFDDIFDRQNIANAAIVVLNTIDVVPVVGLFATPLTYSTTMMSFAKRLAELGAEGEMLARKLGLAKFEKMFGLAKQKAQMIRGKAGIKTASISRKMGLLAKKPYWQLFIIRYADEAVKSNRSFRGWAYRNRNIFKGAAVGSILSLMGVVFYDAYKQFYSKEVSPNSKNSDMLKTLAALQSSIESKDWRSNLIFMFRVTIKNIMNGRKLERYPVEMVENFGPRAMEREWNDIKDDPIWQEPYVNNLKQYKNWRFEQLVEKFKIQIDENPKEAQKVFVDMFSKHIRQIRDEQFKLYNFEKDPETGQLISKKGNQQSAKRWSKEELERQKSIANEKYKEMAQKINLTLNEMPESSKKYIPEAKSDNDINMVSKVLIIDDKDRFLALLRPNDSKYMPNRWDFPGGHLKDGESHKQAAKREVKEETGLTVKGLEEIGEENKRMHVVFYRSTNYSGDIKLDKEENQEFKWVKLSEIDNYDTVPTVNKFAKQELETMKKDLKEQEVPKEPKKPPKLVQFKGGGNIKVLNRVGKIGREEGEYQYSWGTQELIDKLKGLPSDEVWVIGNISKKGKRGTGGNSIYSKSHETGVDVDFAIPLVDGKTSLKKLKTDIEDDDAFNIISPSDVSEDWRGWGKAKKEKKESTGFVNSGDIDSYKSMQLVKFLKDEGFELIILDKSLWKNIGYDFDWNQVNDNIDESDDLYVAAKKYIGRGGAKGVGGVKNDEKHKDHFHARLIQAGKGRFDLTYAEKYWPSDVSGEKEKEKAKDAKDADELFITKNKCGASSKIPFVGWEAKVLDNIKMFDGAPIDASQTKNVGDPPSDYDNDFKKALSSVLSVMKAYQQDPTFQFLANTNYLADEKSKKDFLNLANIKAAKVDGENYGRFGHMFIIFTKGLAPDSGETVSSKIKKIIEDWDGGPLKEKYKKQCSVDRKYPQSPIAKIPMGPLDESIKKTKIKIKIGERKCK